MRCRFAPEALPLEATPVENLFILEYMPVADGTQLRVYLYGLMLCRYPAFDGDTLTQALSLTQEEVLAAYTHWQREGLVRILSTHPLEVEYMAPSQRASGSMLLPGKYGQLIQAAQTLFAPRTLRPQELRKIYDWVDVFGLSEEAVLELISHCIGRSPTISIKYMDAVAQAWADAGVRTAAEAKARADAYNALTSGAGAILRRWNKSRAPTEDELTLYELWTKQWGFTPEAILAACPAVTKAERPSFAYLGSVLAAMHDGGLHTEQAVADTMDEDEEGKALSREVFARMGLGNTATLLQRQQLNSFLSAGLPREVMLYAAEQAQNKDRPFGYLKKLLSDFAEQGVLNMEQARAQIERRAQARPAHKKAADSMDYPQKRYSDEDLQHIFINLNEEA